MLMMKKPEFQLPVIVAVVVSVVAAIVAVVVMDGCVVGTTIEVFVAVVDVEVVDIGVLVDVVSDTSTHSQKYKYILMEVWAL